MPISQALTPERVTPRYLAKSTWVIGLCSPLQIKQAVTGYGKAEKRQVQFMVKEMLRLAAIPKPDDAADALAVAVCHSNWQQANHWQGGQNNLV